jgi:hypothetical protein
MAFFIPWRVVAEESGAAHFGFGGAMLLDLPGPALRLLTIQVKVGRTKREKCNRFTVPPSP